ncbi:uncharacterized protein F5891DRAFT_1147619 [Suillus fuscotomentosus]|uniref:Uncharacterized protein n=1 Tax=Suillus fuscotomentosus TaxID=1912939 RepID=A0AAD4HJM2_9AGAM|nr:uncharacterized protein F5891DRAFT_1147619 [Suillus fuscotomentosus]KAG1898947.1 hypothetical protein F5891DRAFT_1147619 [Suillus fuscotomentosus]
MHLQIPFHGSPFSLDSAGVAGFFGGDETLSAMGTVHLYRGRRWLGWYNSPGSYTVAKRYGQLANSRFWDGLFPGPNSEPAETFGLDGKAGPRYVASLSGTDMATGHLAYLTIQMSKELEGMAVQGKASTETLPASVTVIRVGDVMDMDEVGMMSIHHALLATIPITISIMTCFSCAIFDDWYAFSLILLGIISSGITCFVIGTARLHLRGPKTVTPGVPPGDGLLLTPRDVVVLIGSEKDVNVITKGHFLLGMHGKPEYRSVGLCSLLLLAQFLLQLLLIPQATLFGQMMFLASCAASWVYNSFLSSLESEKIQGDLLCKALQVKDHAVQKYCLHNRRSQAVFACSILSDGNETNEDFDAERMLSLFVPNKTRVWNLWRKKVAAQLKSACPDKIFHVTAEEKEGLCEEQSTLLETFLDDADRAIKAYYEHARYLCSIRNSPIQWEPKDV